MKRLTGTLAMAFFLSMLVGCANNSSESNLPDITNFQKQTEMTGGQKAAQAAHTM